MQAGTMTIIMLTDVSVIINDDKGRPCCYIIVIHQVRRQAG